jgi:hypothetical protein
MFQKFSPRNDYKELLELTIIFLGGVPVSGVKFKRPGAMSSARWMAKALYCLKLCLFRRQLSPSLTATEANGLLRVAVFIVRVYVKVWFSAPDTVAAPRNDLQLLKDLKAYEQVNKKVALAAQVRFQFHSWYLTEVNVGLALFDEELSFGIRNALVQKMLQGSISAHEPPKKIAVDFKSVLNLELLDLVSGNTLRLFYILNVKTDFLQVPAEQWAGREDYELCKRIVTHLCSVNDTGERAVKLMKDYNLLTNKNEDSFQKMLLSVHDLRKALPGKDKTKQALVKKYDSEK